MPDTPREHFQNTLKRLQTERQIWEDGWRDIAEHILPDYKRYLTRNRSRKTVAEFDTILDSTATQALHVLEAGLMSGVTNPSQEWLRVVMPDPQLNDAHSSRVWMDQVSEISLDIFARSNTYRAFPKLYREGAAFGTSAMFVREDADDVIRCMNIAPGEFYVATDERGTINTCYREFSMTVEQVITMFGKETVSPHVENLWERNERHQRVDIVHAIEPTTKPLPEIDSRLPRTMPFRSVYFEKGVKHHEKQFLRVGGFFEFPVVVFRWGTVSTDVYGYGIGHRLLGDIKQLQYQTKTKAEAIQKMVKPPLKAPSSMAGAPHKINTLPDGITYYDGTAGSQPAFGAAYQINIPLQFILEDIAVLQARIRTGFFVDVFQLISQLDVQNKTATEVLELAAEKRMRMGPVLNNIDDEVLDPFFDRTFALAERAGLIPPPPEDIQGQPFRPEYVSILSAAQKAQGLGSIDRFTTFVANLAGVVGPDPLDKIDMDKAVDDYAKRSGVPADLVVPDDVAAQKRQERANIQQAQQLSENANQAADTAQKLSQVPTGGDNLLQSIAEQAGAAS